MNKIKTITTQNKCLTRSGYKPEAIVIHVTEGNLAGALEWVQNVKSQVSYHYIVGQDGSIYEIVPPDAVAWANGQAVESKWNILKDGVNPNLYTLSIAFAGFALQGPTRAQVHAISDLVSELCDKYKIPLDENHVIGHNCIRTDKLCPGVKMDLPSIRYGARLIS